MLKKILCSEDCAKCQICCKFEQDELIDAPTFTEEEMLKSLSKKGNLLFAERGQVYQIVLESWRGKYICPLLTHMGCILDDERPFDCKLWPFYVMRKNRKYVITITEDCPVVNKKSISIIKSCIDNVFLERCRRVISEYPDMITDYNRNMTVLYEFEDKV